MRALAGAVVGAAVAGGAVFLLNSDVWEGREAPVAQPGTPQKGPESQELESVQLDLPVEIVVEPTVPEPWSDGPTPRQLAAAEQYGPEAAEPQDMEQRATGTPSSADEEQGAREQRARRPVDYPRLHEEIITVADALERFKSRLHDQTMDRLGVRPPQEDRQEQVEQEPDEREGAAPALQPPPHQQRSEGGGP